MPYEAVFMTVTLSMREDTGFKRDMEALLKVSKACKVVCNERYNFTAKGYVSGDVEQALDDIDAFVAYFFPPDDAAPPDDQLPQFDFGDGPQRNVVVPPSRAQRRAAGDTEPLVRKAKATFKDGQWVHEDGDPTESAQ